MLTNAKPFVLVSAAILIGLQVVDAHGHIVSWDFAGQKHAGFNPMYPPHYGVTATRPTDNSEHQGPTDYNSSIVACGGASAGTGLETWDLNAGESVTAVWDSWPEEHRGPVTEYMAACPSSGCDGVDASSLTWFKIQEDTFDGTVWPTASITSTHQWTFKIPTDLAAGPYLVRHDILAMHFINAPQVYPYCFQANLISSGSTIPKITTTFPDAYKVNTEFLTWNIWDGDQNGFVPPGPAVYSAADDDTPVYSTAPVVSSAAASSSAAVRVCNKRRKTKR